MVQSSESFTTCHVRCSSSCHSKRDFIVEFERMRYQSSSNQGQMRANVSSDYRMILMHDENNEQFSFLSRAGIPEVNKNGDLLLLYVGIIDILQNYRLRKKLEHAFKSTLVTRVRVSTSLLKLFLIIIFFFF